MYFRDEIAWKIDRKNNRKMSDKMIDNKIFFHVKFFTDNEYYNSSYRYFFKTEDKESYKDEIC